MKNYNYIGKPNLTNIGDNEHHPGHTSSTTAWRTATPGRPTRPRATDKWVSVGSLSRIVVKL